MINYFWWHSNYIAIYLFRLSKVVRFSGASVDEDEPGFIGRLFTRNDEESAAIEQDFSVRLVDEDGVVTVTAEPLESADDLSDLTAELLLVINNNLS